MPVTARRRRWSTSSDTLEPDVLLLRAPVDLAHHYVDRRAGRDRGRDRVAGHQAAGPAREAGATTPPPASRTTGGSSRIRSTCTPTSSAPDGSYQLIADSDTELVLSRAVRDPAADRGHHSVTEPLWEDEGRPRAAALGPVKVRVPAKINLHLGCRPAARGRLPRAGHDLPRDRALRRDHRPAGRLARADHGRRGRRQAGPRRHQPGDPGGEALAARHRPRTRTPGCTCASRSRSRPAWPAAAPTRRPRWWPATRSWGTGYSREDLASVAATPRLGRAVPGARRHRARHRPRRDGQPGAGPGQRLALGGRGRRRRAVHPGGLPRAGRLREAGRPRRRSARRTRSWPRCASGTRRCWPSALGNDLQAAALSLRPELRETLDAGCAAGALAGLVSGSGPTCVFLCRDAAHAEQLAADVEARELPGGRGGPRTGPRRPAAPSGSRTPRSELRSRRGEHHQPGPGQQGLRRGRALLTDVSLGLDEADRVGVVGLNGAGKSTLLRLLTTDRGARRRPGHPPARPAGAGAAAGA